MMGPAVRAWLVAATIGLVGCGYPATGDIDGTSAEAVEARGVLDSLAHGDIDSVAPRLDDTQRTPDLPDKLRHIAALYPKNDPTRVRVVGFWHQRTMFSRSPARESVTITLESNYYDANVLLRVVFQRIGDGERRIVGLHADPLPAPLDVLNAFTFSNKGVFHYLFLMIMAGVAVVITKATVVWVRQRKSIRLRWWWWAAILLGACRIAFNWTNGDVGIQWLTVRPLGLGCFRAGLDAPWVLTVSIPVGAIAFLVRQRRAKRVQRDEDSAKPEGNHPSVST